MGVRIRSIAKKRWKLALACSSLVVLGGFGWVFTDRVVSEILDRLRPELEKELSVPLGHPLKIGSYKGLRLWGFAIGKSEILKGTLDDSQAIFTGGRIAFAPLASFLQWRPVVDVKLRGAKFIFRPNKDGTYWALGKVKGDSPPKVDLRFKLSNPAKLIFEPSNFVVNAIAKGQVHFGIRRVGGTIKLIFPKGGRLLLKGQGGWGRHDMRVSTRFHDLKLGSLQKLFGIVPFQSDGVLEGDFAFAIANGNVRCNGGLKLDEFSLKTSTMKESIASQKTSIRCGRDRVNLRRSEWKYGLWSAEFGGDFLLNSSSDLPKAPSGLLRVNYFGDEDQKLKAALPVKLTGAGLRLGELDAVLSLNSIPLSPLGEGIGIPIGGTLTTSGQILGKLSSLRPNLLVRVESPQYGSLRLQEDWRGNLRGRAENAAGGVLRMAPVGDVIPATLSAGFVDGWRLQNLRFTRANGWLSLSSQRKLPGVYSWEAERLKLDGVEFSIPPHKRFERVFGKLSGEGSLDVGRQSFEGQLEFSDPMIMGLQLRKALLEGSYVDKYYSLNGDLFPPDIGEVSLKTTGVVGGRLNANAEARGVSAKWLTVSALQLPKINLGTLPASGTAKDLGTLLMETFGGSIDGQLKAISASKDFLRKQDENPNGQILDPQDLRGQLDADIKLTGPDLSKLNLSLAVEGKLWSKGQVRQSLSASSPFVATFNGPIQGGEGTFSILNIPFSLLSLVGPVPSSLYGGIGLAGKYRRKEEDIDLSADLILENAKLGENSLKLDRGKILFAKSVLDVDILFRSESSTESIKLKGSLPIDPKSPIDLRAESHGDGLNFLTDLSDGGIELVSGISHMRLIVSGTYSEPKANGYFVIRDGQIKLDDQLVSELNTSVIFDFNRLEVQSLEGRVADDGLLSGKGAIALLKPSIERQPLTFKMRDLRLDLPVANVDITGKLILTRSLLKPTFGGDLTIDNGSISPGKTGLVSSRNRNPLPPKGEDPKSNSSSLDFGQTPYKKYEEQGWDFEKPLVLLGPDVEANASKMLRASIPNVSSLSFDNLLLRLGPDLRITSQPLANFNAEGLLTLNGSLGPSLQPRGVVRLLGGRVNLFTTTFNLDRKAPNVAVFTPSLGLIPYVDVTLTSRVAENVGEGNNNLGPSNVFSSNGTGPFGVGGFRLVKVMVQATGPADRIAENIQLRSSPPMPRAQLLGLIGGNTLAGLSGGGDSEMIATVLGRSLLSPVLGTISDSFSDRLQLSLYPTFVTPESKEKSSDIDSNSKDEATGPAPPERAWVTEVGIDLTERFNFSVLATPNRNDIPPQGTLTYQMTPNLGVAGSLDNEGTWQSQLQMFFRF